MAAHMKSIGHPLPPSPHGDGDGDADTVTVGAQWTGKLLFHGTF